MANNTVTDVVQPLPFDVEVAVPSEAEQEGGFQAWLTVAGSFLVYFASFGVINSFGFFQSYYQQITLSTYPPSAIALIGTLQITLMSLSGSVAGVLFDTYGLKVSIECMLIRNGIECC